MFELVIMIMIVMSLVGTRLKRTFFLPSKHIKSSLLSIRMLPVPDLALEENAEIAVGAFHALFVIKYCFI